MVKKIHIHEKLTKCYACGEKATGLRDRRPEGKELEPACGRHAEPNLQPVECCMYCDSPVRKGSYDIDGIFAHAKCYKLDVNGGFSNLRGVP